ncbi:MAG: YbhB/YbcL family Raf kinase inhibitor-like protein [Patescibacteria group bacterium]|nr:YbhB/YbcL family Raf kinase inhibitor-like protein [Patescibacteria group bacterium]
MKVFSSGIDGQGHIAERFGKYASENDKIDNTPVRSLPISWQDLPEGTKSLALIMQDYDAIPVCGFSWIHWLVANIDPNKNKLVENASREDNSLLQGHNSLVSRFLDRGNMDKVNSFYAGPQPPDKDHEYEIIVYALDTKLDLKPDFKMNELLKDMRGHVLASEIIRGIYKV